MSDRKNIRIRYNSLIKIVNKHNLLYHTYDSPEISDAAYDNYYSELKKIEKMSIHLLFQKILQLNE